MPLDIFDISIRLVVAAILGGLIGLERDIHGRSAGLRTQMLVSLGAALFTLVSISMIEFAGESRMADPGRIAAQIIAGIGFLGAGSIIKSGFTVRGLTTAASLWVAAGIGMSVGAGYFIMAGITTLLVMLTLLLMRPFGAKYKKDSFKRIVVTSRGSSDFKKVIQLIKKEGYDISDIDVERDYLKKIVVVSATLRMSDTEEMAAQLISRLEKSKLPLISVQWGNEGELA